YRAALGRVLLDTVRHSKVAPASAPAAPAAPMETPRPAEGTKATGLIPTGDAPASALSAKVSGTLVAGNGLCYPALSSLPQALLVQASGVGPAEGGAEAAADARLAETLELAERLIAAGDFRGHLIKGEALARVGGRWSEAMKSVQAGLELALPEGEG